MLLQEPDFLGCSDEFLRTRVDILNSNIAGPQGDFLDFKVNTFQKKERNFLGRNELHSLVAMNVEGAISVNFGHLFGQPAGKSLANAISAALATDTEVMLPSKNSAAAQPPGT